jgi:ATP-dependent DNA helicase RecG
VTDTRLSELLKNGEGLTAEFKRCSGRVESDVFESICAFMNRFGGDVLLGVEDDGTVVGVKGDAVAIRNNIMNVANDGNLFDPVAYIAPEIVEHEGKTLVHVRVPVSGEVHAYKGVVYDRNGDADVRVRSTAAKGLMILRKQGIFTERKIYPYVAKSDLELSVLKRLRVRAQNNSRDERRHPWMDMDDDQLLRSAKLVGTDRETGKSGFNLAAVMLLGTEDVIKDICPAYVTDAILRVKNLDRYDDRDIVTVNLISAYDRLMEFACKHLPDPFFLEGDVRRSLREIIVREMVANTLVHREFTSSRPARFVIEQDRMFVENACRASSGDVLTPDNFTPEPRNPIIANFFRVIGYADQLGSGVRNLFKYSKAYGGADPQLTDGDVFRTEISLKALNLAPMGMEVARKGTEVAQIDLEVAQKSAEVARMLRGKGRRDAINNALAVFSALQRDGSLSIETLSSITHLSNGSVKNAIRLLRLNGIITREGSDRGGRWVVLA